MIVTFYSYKGGTGRTMAMANVAAVLARRGRRVLAVDFDLEAPGLWRYFSSYYPQLDQQPGLTELLADATAATSSFEVDWRNYVSTVPIEPSGLSVITSGQLNEKYSSRVLNFDWTAFFKDADGGEYLERMRRQWREEYDFVLIDSRTGITDTGGICTIMLPDLIVPVFTSNMQSIEGAVDVVARAQARRKNLAYDRPPAAILPLLSRFDSTTEYESAKEWLEIAADRFRPFYDDWLPSHLSPEQALERTKLPYVAFFSFGEKLPALTESTSDPASLAYALNSVAQLIEQELGNAAAFIAGDSTTVPVPAANAPAGDLPDDTVAATQAAVRVFLSHAQDDAEIAEQIASQLRQDGLEVADRLDQANHGKRFTAEIENAIQQADAFLVLLSPAYLASGWCRAERQLATQLEQDRQQAGQPHRLFVRTLQVQSTPDPGASFPALSDRLDLTDPATRETAIRQLAFALRPDTGPGRADAPAASPPPVFLDREDELRRILSGLTSPAGPHFWLVIAPPQAGKSWFLDQVAAAPALSEPGRWTIKRLDLRSQSPDLRHDADALITYFFGEQAAGSQPDRLRSIARQMLRRGQPQLCVLDSAELLDPDTAAAVRQDLSQIHALIASGARQGVRLALVVAGRRGDAWRGVLPGPRMSPLVLTEFSAAVVEEAIRQLAEETGRYLGAEEARQDAWLVHGLTEGLPALLTRSLDWIQENQWFGIDQLARQETFEDIAGPYVQDGLLTQRSLLPLTDQPEDKARYALVQAFRALAPYRLFTQAHLRFCLNESSAFRAAVTDARWSLAELWRAVSGASLLVQPSREPWHTIQPAIRRLLFRYFYRTPEQRSLAHGRAREFVERWSAQLMGTDQVIGLVECLHHEAVMLGQRQPAQLADQLTGSAARLSAALIPSGAYTTEELRVNAAERMMADQEFQEVVSGVDGLPGGLAEALTGRDGQGAT